MNGLDVLRRIPSGYDFFSRAELRVPPKKAVALRLDEDVLEWFTQQGQGYQTRINQLLRLYMQTKQQQ